MQLALILLLTLLPIVPAQPAGQTATPAVPDGRFTNVDGASLATRMEAAVKQGRDAGASHFWVAFGFDVRPGVAVDLEVLQTNGRITRYEGLSPETSTRLETKNLGVFLLYERTTAKPDRVEVYNLDRKRGYDGYTVYWVGRVASDESLKVLGDLLASQPTAWVAERTVAAIALHADPRADDMLEGIARSSPYDGARIAALRWLGVVTDRVAFLAGVVRDEQEKSEMRSQAALSIGLSSSPAAVSTLTDLFAGSLARELREQIVDAAGIHDRREDGDAALDFLIKVADTERDLGIRKKAIFWLGQKAGMRAMAALESKLASPEDEVQVEAVFAISQRPKDEAVPVLMRLARTHPNRNVQRQAIFWLGQIDDERVVPFLKELLGR